MASALPAPAVANAQAQGLNYLHTDGARIVDSRGKEVLITGVSWFGMETDTLAPHGLWARNWEQMMDQLASMGFNTIRLPYSNELFDPTLQPQGIDYSLNPDLKGLNGIQIMDKIIEGAGKRGLKVILDQHRPTTSSQSKLWYTDEISEEQWIKDWQTLAKRYAGNDTVIGADLHNEPAGDATWGSGDPKTDWRLAAERAGNAVLAVNPNWLIIVEGIEKTTDDLGNTLDWYWMGGSLQNARIAPVRLNVPNRLVYSAHDYGPDVYNQGWFSDPKFPENLTDVWDFHWGYLVKEGIAPVILGEFGGTSVGNDPEGIWQRSLVAYLKQNKIGYLYWSFNGNSGDTGGLLTLDWNSVQKDKLDLLKKYQGAKMDVIAPTVVDTSAVPSPRPPMRAVKAFHYDKNHDDWSKVLTPEIHVANRTNQPMDISNLEVRYYYTADGDASLYDQPGAQTVRMDQVTVGEKLPLDKVKAEIVKDTSVQTATDQQYYVKLTFAPGTVVPPKVAEGVKLIIERKDGGTYYQANDFSRREYHWPTEWDHITIYKDGKLVWGTDPQTYQAQERQKLEDIRRRALGDN